MRRCFLLLVLAVGCAPAVGWLEAPAGAKTALVDETSAPIVAYDVEAGLRAVYGGDAEVEVAFYDADLETLGLPAGEIEIVEDGVELEAPTAIFGRGAGGDWVSRESLSPRLSSVRRILDDPRCPGFAVETSNAFVNVGVRFVLRIDGVRVLVGNELGDVFFVDADLSSPSVIQVDAGGEDVPVLTAARFVGGGWPYLFGASDGTIWRGRYSTTLEIERVAPAPEDSEISLVAGSLDPLDIHVVLHIKDETRDVVWMRYDGTSWQELSQLARTGRTTTYDLLFVAADDVLATVLADDGGTFRFDGRRISQENVVPLASLDIVGGTVYGGGLDALHVRDRNGWRIAQAIDNVGAFALEPPLATIPWADDLLTLGKSFVVRIVGEHRCPTTYIDPDRPYTFAMPTDAGVLAASYGRKEQRTSLIRLRSEETP